MGGGGCTLSFVDDDDDVIGFAAKTIETETEQNTVDVLEMLLVKVWRSIIRHRHYFFRSENLQRGEGIIALVCSTFPESTDSTRLPQQSRQFPSSLSLSSYPSKLLWKR